MSFKTCVSGDAAEQVIKRGSELVAGACSNQLVKIEVGGSAIDAYRCCRGLLDRGHLERRSAQSRKSSQKRLDRDPHLDDFHRIGGAHQVFAVVAEERLALGFGGRQLAIGAQHLQCAAQLMALDVERLRYRAF